MLNQCWFDVEPASTTLVQHQTSIGSPSRVCWVCRHYEFIQCWLMCYSEMMLVSAPPSVYVITATTYCPHWLHVWLIIIGCYYRRRSTPPRHQQEGVIQCRPDVGPAQTTVYHHLIGIWVNISCLLRWAEWDNVAVPNKLDLLTVFCFNVGPTLDQH